MQCGIIKGGSISKNKDGDKDRLLLQVEFMPEDVRIVELINMSGEDTYPANGCRILVVNAGGFLAGIAITDDLLPECEAGEKELYSTNNPATSKLARIKLNKSSEIILNQGTDYGVMFSKLKEVADELKQDITNLKSAFSSWVVVPNDGGQALKTAAATWTGTALTKNIDAAKVTKVRI
jgi:hypothetical protein